ncbi:unnamed protein product [Clavelina lepadiformis]|uniref:Uncharacterized protein n=1 Tax=Clavelina lepadiformis TaxID=159417 RepID=A0ABP0GQS5_CLALP
MQPDGNRIVTPNVDDLVEKETEGKRKILDKVQSNIQRQSTLRPAKETKTISGSHMSQATPNPQAKNVVFN